MPSYDAQHHDPPAPIARVIVRNPDNHSSVVEFDMLIDTGADVTLLPRAGAGHLGVSLVDDVRYELAAFDGSKSVAPVAVLDMIFLNRVYRGRYVLIEGESGVIGRDVLNHVALLFDDPQQQWLESK